MDPVSADCADMPFQGGPHEDEPPAGRAPLAVAASIFVMLAGASFLTLSAATNPVPATASPPARVLSSPAAEPTGKPALPTDAVAPEPLFAPTANMQAGEMADAAPERRGLFPRLNPRRAETRNIAAEGETAGDGGFAPRLKPTPGGADAPATENTTEEALAPDAAAPAETMIAMGAPFAADDADGPPPVFFASDLAADRAGRPPVTVAFAGDLAEAPQTLSVELRKGETFVDAMRRAGVRAEDRNAAAYAFGEYQDLRYLRPGQSFELTLGEASQTLFQLVAQDHEPESYLLALDFRPDAENRISVRREEGGAFDAEKSVVKLTSRTAGVAGRIGGSLFMSAKRQGAPDKVIADLANIFAYDVDFQREIFGGDEYEAIFELKYDEDGRMVGSGDILYARLNWRGQTKEKGYYRFATDENDGRADYYDATGQSAKRLLMKTPIDGARLSSGFGTRRHPILGYAKAHKGVDFAAPRGTPIYAAGDGVVERANRYGSFGNYVKIRHANGYKTAYAHLNGFARGMRSGKHVKQGDVIAYVGTTGRSTGPHLHYEVHHNGVQVNPMKLKMATGVQLKGGELERFKTVRDRIDMMRRPATANPPLVTADADKGKQL